MLPIQTRTFPSPLGKIIACATEQGLCLLEFVGSKSVEREQQDLQRLLQRPLVIGDNEHLQQTEAELGEYFSGGRQQFSVALHTPSTPFQAASGAISRPSEKVSILVRLSILSFL